MLGAGLDPSVLDLEHDAVHGVEFLAAVCTARPVSGSRIDLSSRVGGGNQTNGTFEGPASHGLRERGRDLPMTDLEDPTVARTLLIPGLVRLLATTPGSGGGAAHLTGVICERCWPIRVARQLRASRAPVRASGRGMVPRKPHDEYGCFLDEVRVEVGVAKPAAGACRAESARSRFVTLVTMSTSRPLTSAAMEM